jgi:CBS domain-containing protein
VEPSTSVAAAVTVMGMQRVGAVLVVEKGRLEGIFTERDLVRALSCDIGASSQPVAQWMTRDPVTVGPKQLLRKPWKSCWPSCRRAKVASIGRAL